MSSDKIPQFIHFNTIMDYLRSEAASSVKNMDFEKYYSIFDASDKEDINGKIFNEDEMTDMLLNENEQKKFLEQIKTNMPELYDELNNFFSIEKEKPENDILVDNLTLLADPISGVVSEATIKATFEHLNCENVIDAIERFDSRGTNPMFYTILEQTYMWNNEKIVEMMMDKYNTLAEYIIDKSKEKNIYVADYEKALQEYSSDKDYKNYAITLDRLYSRYSVETDYDKSLNASKRKLELKEPNGTIDETFVQGYTRNCWFISAITSMALNPTFLKRLNDMITVNKEGDKITSVTVNIQGKNYDIDYDTLKNANEYSSGDLDVRALEIAVNQYMHENHLGDLDIGNFSSTAYMCLFGEDNITIDNYRDDKYDLKSNEYLEAIKNDKSLISTIAHIFGETELYATDANGQNILLLNNHAYSVTEIDTEFLYFKDPHNITQELKIPIKDFDKYFDDVQTCKLKA